MVGDVADIIEGNPILNVTVMDVFKDLQGAAMKLDPNDDRELPRDPLPTNDDVAVADNACRELWCLVGSIVRRRSGPSLRPDPRPRH